VKKIFSKFLDLLGFIIFIPFAIVLIYKLYSSSVSPWLGIPLVFVSGVIGFILTDIISGVGHWLADRYGSIDTPILGNHFIFPFRSHHLYPMDMTKLGFIKSNGNNCLASG